MVDLPNTMVDLPNTMVDLPYTMVDLRNTLEDLPNTMVDLPNTLVDLPNAMVNFPSLLPYILPSWLTNQTKPKFEGFKVLNLHRIVVSWYLGHSSPIMHKVVSKTHEIFEKLKIMSWKSNLFWHFLWSIFRSLVLTSEFF